MSRIFRLSMPLKFDAFERTKLQLQQLIVPASHRSVQKVTMSKSIYFQMCVLYRAYRCDD